MSNWRREDTGYAAAATAAVAFVAYLMAANFGLVPAPIPGFGGAPPASAAIEIPAGLVPTAPPASIGAIPPPTTTPTPGPVFPVDRVAPAVAISTSEGANFGVTDPAVVEGVANDAASGVENVLVTFTSGSRDDVVPAKVTCSDESRRSCTWTAEVPGVVADYTVAARALDNAGNSAASKEIGVTVVNTGGTVKQVTDTVGQLPDLLDSVVLGLRGAL